MKNSDRNRDLAKIHIAKKQLTLSDDEYRDLLWTVARVRSAKDLDAHGRQKLIKHFESRGVNFHKQETRHHDGHPGVAGEDRNKLINKVEAQLADMGLPWSYADAIASNMFGIQRVRFCSPKQLHAVIAALYNKQKKDGNNQKQRSPRSRVQAINDEAVGRDLSSWEKHQFLPGITDRHQLSPKEERILAGIEKRLGLAGDDEE